MNRKFSVVSPIDQNIYLERTYAREDKIGEVVALAHKAKEAWRNRSVRDRSNYCQKAIDYLVSKADVIGEEITMQMGRPIRYAANEVKGGVKERGEYMISIAEKALENVVIDDLRFIKKVPLGCVMVLAPWNYPFLTAVNAIIPSLLAGNTVILKHSDQTPLTAERFKEAFDFAGLPDGVFNYLHIDHDQVAEVIKDKRINYVAFTGSVSGGRAVTSALSDTFTGAGFELGGKDAAYVRTDANLTHAVENLVDGSFFNSGQSCCGIERIYVHASVYDEFKESFIDLVKKYRMGDPLNSDTEIGPMISNAAADRVKAEIEEAVEKGAVRCVNRQDSDRGAFLFPEVLVDLGNDMKIMQEETFGPLVGIIKVMSDDQAVKYINDSKYGLTSSIWTQDDACAERLGDLLEVGTVFVNRCDYLDPALAWTGVKNSGRGCTLSSLGFESLTRPKSFHIRKI